MSDVAIKVENLSKLYQLGEVGTGTISHDLNRWWARIRGKEDPYTKIGQTNDRTRKVDSDFVWALKDINFEVKQGEVLGIIGRNGAGKSTLLKILSKITSPTTGKIYTKGRIASLLEVGTGFHPEMTGRENIYLNGAILGMRKWEIDKKFDEIVDFAGVEAYIDTPVKRYSSGMYVRLAFAVAAFLEPEILIVDEVLAVGDAEFQKKCLGRMRDVSENDGRTVLFVSHNMFAIQNLCKTGIVLQNGELKFFDKASKAVSYYINQFSNVQTSIKYNLDNAPGNIYAKFLRAEILPLENRSWPIFEGDSFCLEFDFFFLGKTKKNLNITFHLIDEYGNLVFVGSTGSLKDTFFGYGKLGAKCIIPPNLMNHGIYTISRLLLVQDRGNIIHELSNPISFEIRPAINEKLGWMGAKEGVIKPELNWEYFK